MQKNDLKRVIPSGVLALALSGNGVMAENKYSETLPEPEEIVGQYRVGDINGSEAMDMLGSWRIHNCMIHRDNLDLAKPRNETISSVLETILIEDGFRKGGEGDLKILRDGEPQEIYLKDNSNTGKTQVVPSSFECPEQDFVMETYKNIYKGMSPMEIHRYGEEMRDSF